MKAPALLYERVAPTLSIHLKSAEGDWQARWPWDRMLLAKSWAAETSNHTAGGGYSGVGRGAGTSHWTGLWLVTASGCSRILADDIIDAPVWPPRREQLGSVALVCDNSSNNVFSRKNCFATVHQDVRGRRPQSETVGRLHLFKLSYGRVGTCTPEKV